MASVSMHHTALWHDFQQSEQLNDRQWDQFIQYAQLLVQRAAEINLTTITQEEDIINYHFKDSLAAGHFLKIAQCHTIADIGTGGGFPGIPLKIKFPHLKVYLLEVNQKKINFLREVIAALGLADIEIIDLDWRTFLRSTTYSIDLFCARASLAPAELLRMFQPSSTYRHAQLVYWASTQWQPTTQEERYLVEKYPYIVGDKKRILIQFAAKKETFSKIACPSKLAESEDPDKRSRRFK